MKQIDMYFMRHGKKRDLQNIISPQIVLEELPKIEHGSVEDLLFNGITPRAIELIKEQGNSHLSGNHYDQVDLFTSLAYRTQITAQSFVAGAGLADVATLDTSNDLGYHNLGIDFNDPLFPYLDDSTREGQDTYIKEAMQQ